MENIRKAFDSLAQEYDKHREHIIPDFHQFYGSAVWAAESPLEEPNILDIGAGTGLLSMFVLKKFPHATITLMDFAKNMLEIARKRFSGNNNINYIVTDYSKSDIGGPYDIVCSALSIHHLISEDKKKLFKKIYSALNPGGIFVNADQSEGETPYFSNRYQAYWNDFLMSGSFNEPERLEILRRRCEMDQNEKLSDQIRWLSNAGFSDVDVVYRNRTFLVTVGKK
ncbi:MAG: class I SAM-dependent methyltransferase [Methanomicrobiales archaeon]|nr:class I SAM-dependent methyltransferase [Methanomicrobiales archaeon]